MATPSKDIYLREVLCQVPRLLGLLDRNVLSSTYGCFDRNYWHYSTSDFANARKQEAVLSLALLYSTRHKGNPYCGKKSMLELINASLKFWHSIQHGNGSFSEWYPNEHSFVATAFSGYAVSETLLLLKNGIEEREGIIKGLEKVADFVAKHFESRACNQETGSIAFLYNLFLLTGKKKYKVAAKEKLKLFLLNQSQEGWFSEYGGFDSGYHSLAIDYLAKYYARSDDKRVLPALRRAVDFLCFFAQPDGSFGGAYCSRNTEYVVPHGLELLAGKITNAALLAKQVRKSIAGHAMVSLASLDDNYLCYNAYTYLQAFRYGKEKLQAKGMLPFKHDFERIFPESGIFVKSTAAYYLVASIFKGGAFKLCLADKSQDDFGLLVETAVGKRLFSSAFNRANEFRAEPGCLKVHGFLAFVPNKVLSPAKNILLRTYQLSAGRHQKISAATKELLRDKLITKQRLSTIAFSREISFTGKRVSVSDSLQRAHELKNVFIGHSGMHIYVPSSNYFFPRKADSTTKRLSWEKIRSKTSEGVFNLKRNLC